MPSTQVYTVLSNVVKGKKTRSTVFYFAGDFDHQSNCPMIFQACTVDVRLQSGSISIASLGSLSTQPPGPRPVTAGACRVQNPLWRQLITDRGTGFAGDTSVDVFTCVEPIYIAAKPRCVASLLTYLNLQHA